MLDEVVTTLARIETVDMQFQVFGAEHHCFQLDRCLLGEDLAWEGWLGVAFPEPFRKAR